MPTALDQAPGGALIGFRTFVLWPNGGVTGLSVHEPWFAGVNEAAHDECDSGPCPGDRCHCGFNAYHDPDRVRTGESSDLVAAAVVGWGDVQLHADGWRSQFARVVAVASGSDNPMHQQRVRLAAARLGVPVVDHADLQSVVLEHGRTVRPDELPGPAKQRAANHPDQYDRIRDIIERTVMTVWIVGFIACWVMVVVSASPIALGGALAMLAITALAVLCVGGLEFATMCVLVAALVVGTYVIRSRDLGGAARDKVERVAEQAASIEREASINGNGPYLSADSLFANHPALAEDARRAGARVKIQVERPSGGFRVEVDGKRGAHAERVIPPGSR